MLWKISLCRERHYLVVSTVWAPLVEMAHLANSSRTRSALVSITMLSSLTARWCR